MKITNKQAEMLYNKLKDFHVELEHNGDREDHCRIGILLREIEAANKPLEIRVCTEHNKFHYEGEAIMVNGPNSIPACRFRTFVEKK